ncbi:hypothetical protein E2562_019164 [Oryza meyeriana var. granulata]|uniref:Uncharacterized protein n=1 Tax=Oryza meyeriana var. granulata TaxID=110450 RepID=A0A6G1CS10_9ORYZ|nr:hypothetical protein E2562_019164 [Oryza meyeriana var. granulata]
MAQASCKYAFPYPNPGEASGSSRVDRRFRSRRARRFPELAPSRVAVTAMANPSPTLCAANLETSNAREMKPMPIHKTTTMADSRQREI